MLRGFSRINFFKCAILASPFTLTPSLISRKRIHLEPSIKSTLLISQTENILHHRHSQNKPPSYASIIYRIISLFFIWFPSLSLLPIYYIYPFNAWNYLLLWSIENSGSTFIKLGQYAASRRDLFPLDLCLVLSKLHANAKPHSYDDSIKILGQGIEIEEETIGVGSVAQIHPSKLKSENEKRVAIKILHPLIHSQISTDLYILRSIANLINIIPSMKWLSLPQEVSFFSFMMKQQTNLNIESTNLLKFIDNFKDVDEIIFPRPFYSDEDVLVEEYFDSLIPISDFFNATTKEGEDVSEYLSGIGIDAFLKMLILDNFVHSDLHPGNVYVYREPNSPPRLVFLDAGLTCKLSPRNKENFISLFSSLVGYDGYKVGELMIERSENPASVIDAEKFKLEMDCFVHQVQESTFLLKNLKVGEILAKVFRIVGEHHVKLEPEFINTAISIMLIEGIGRELNPNIDLLQRSIPFLQQAMINESKSLQLFYEFGRNFSLLYD